MKPGQVWEFIESGVTNDDFWGVRVKVISVKPPWHPNNPTSFGFRGQFVTEPKHRAVLYTASYKGSTRDFDFSPDRFKLVRTGFAAWFKEHS